jgi:hypothetical protein
VNPIRDALIEAFPYPYPTPTPTPAPAPAPALQTEIQNHNLSTFMHEQHKIVLTGCSFCRKHFGTVEQFKFHIIYDVLPPELTSISDGSC